MTWFDRRTDLDTWRLDRDWDALAAGEPASAASPLDPSIKRFHEEGTRAAPSGVFVQHLEETLMRTHLVTPAMTPAAPTAVAKGTVQPKLPSTQRHRKSWPLLDVAAMLLIAAGIVAFLVVQNGLPTLPWWNGDADPPLQQITGGPSTSALPIAAATPAATPEVMECTVEPRTIEEVIAMVGIVSPARWDDQYSRSFSQPPTLDVRPTGVLAPPEIVAEIQFTFDQWLDCMPYDNQLDGMWFLSEEAIKRDLNTPLNSDMIVALQVPNEFSGPTEITDIVLENPVLLADGRVVVDIRIVVPPEAGVPEFARTSTDIMVKENGLWRLDETVETGQEGGVSPATPATGFSEEPLVPTETPATSS